MTDQTTADDASTPVAPLWAATWADWWSRRSEDAPAPPPCANCAHAVLMVETTGHDSAVRQRVWCEALRVYRGLGPGARSPAEDTVMVSCGIQHPISIDWIGIED